MGLVKIFWGKKVVTIVSLGSFRVNIPSTFSVKKYIKFHWKIACKRNLCFLHAFFEIIGENILLKKCSEATYLIQQNVKNSLFVSFMDK